MSADAAFPYGFDASGRTARAGEDDHVEDMIEQFLFTAAGERVMAPEFGSGVLQTLFDRNSPEVAAALALVVQAGLQRWLGVLIEVADVTVTSADATLSVRVVSTVRRTGEVRTRVFERGLV